MNDPNMPSPEPKRPSYGLPADAAQPSSGAYESTNQGGNVAGSDRQYGTSASGYGEPATGSNGAPASYGQSSAPQYGSANGSYGQGSANQYGSSGSSYGQGSANVYPAQSANTAPSPYGQGNQQAGSQNSWQPSSGQNPSAQGAFGGFGTDGSTNSYHTGAPAKKQKPVGIVLTILGVLGMLLGLILLVVGLFKGFGGMFEQMGGMDAVSSTNSEFDGSTATYDFTINELEMLMVYIPEKDASSATCTATLTDGTQLEASGTGDTSSSTLTINGEEYVMYKAGFMSTANSGPGTLTCENVSNAVSVMGPIDVGSFMGWGFGATLGGAAIGFLGFVLFMVGIIVMLVRARNRRKAL